MKFQYYVKTDTGSTRPTNQDFAYANCIETRSGNAFLGVVCDGMGGLSHGEMASRNTASYFTEWFEQEFKYVVADGDISVVISSQWSQLVTEANNALRQYSMEAGCSMGTTLSAILVFGGRYYIAQIGDSRVYLLIEDRIQQITKDHSLVSELCSSGRITEEEARNSSERNIITRCIGVMDKVAADFYTGTVGCGYSFIVCSDGFCSRMSCEDILAMLGNEQSRSGDLKLLLDKAVDYRINDFGEKDNITAVWVRIEKEALAEMAEEFGETQESGVL